MRQVTIEAVVEISYTPGEHVNYNASQGARTRTQSYDQFSAGMRTRHNRNGSASTTIFPRFIATLRCSDGIPHELDIGKLFKRKRLTQKVRDSLASTVEEYCVGMPLRISNSGEIDYEELVNTLRARKAASITE